MRLLLLLSIAPILLAVEGVSPSPDFLEPELKPLQERITFPTDMEQFFHKPFVRFLSSQKPADTLQGFLCGGPQSGRGFLHLRTDDITLDGNGYILKGDYATKRNVSATASTVHLIAGKLPSEIRLNGGYSAKRWGIYSPNTMSASGRGNVMLALPADVIALHLEGDGLSLHSNANYQQASGGMTVFNQHHFSDNFGEEVRLSAQMGISRMAGTDWYRHRVLSAQVNLLGHTEHIVGRLGIRSESGYFSAVTVPTLQLWLRYYPLELSITYDGAVEIARYDARNPEVAFEPFLMDTRIPHRLTAKGFYNIGKGNSVIGKANHSITEHYHYIAQENTDAPLVIKTTDAELSSVSFSLSSVSDNFSNSLSLLARRFRFKDSGLYIPLVPRMELSDTVSARLGIATIWLSGYYRSATEIAAMKDISAGAGVAIGNWHISARLENLLDDPQPDEQGFTRKGIRFEGGIGYGGKPPTLH